MAFSNVPYGEKVPLRVVECIVVKVEIQVVLTLSDALSLSKVARLKLSIKKDCLLIDVANVKRFGRVGKFLRLEVGSDSTPFY